MTNMKFFQALSNCYFISMETIYRNCHATILKD